MGTKRTKGTKGGGPAPSTIAGIMAGLDQDAFRTTPPPHELVRKGEIVKRTIAGDGGIEVVWPGDDDPPDGSLDGGSTDEAASSNT